MKTKCRMLEDADFAAVVATMKAGFSDYFIKVDLDEDGCRKKFGLEGVNLQDSVGAFVDGRMVGVTVNGSGVRQGKITAYDASTAVIPAFRRKHVSTSMFEHLLPELERRGFEEYVLEVIVENEKAIGLYEKFGFQKRRNVGVFAPGGEFAKPIISEGLELRKIGFPDVCKRQALMSDFGCTWQNSNDWLTRAESIGYEMLYLGAFAENEIIGFGAVALHSGRIPRLFVVPEWTGKGIGKLILTSLAAESVVPLLFINVDLADVSALGFLTACGFVKTIEQYEMKLEF